MIVRRDDWTLDIPEDRPGLRNVLAVALVLFCIFAVAVAVGLTVADDHTESESATPAKYTNPDGAPPYCVTNFMEAGLLCNTNPGVVELSKLALDSGDTESAAHRWAKECANNGDPIDDCLDFAKAPLTGLAAGSGTSGQLDLSGVPSADYVTLAVTGGGSAASGTVFMLCDSDRG